MEQSILTKQQKAFLASLSENNFLAKEFYLTGGTALTEYYLHHRESEDLDFFCESEFDIQPLTIFVSQLKSHLRFEKIDYQQSFNRNLFFLHFPKGDILKIEFTYFPFPRLEKKTQDNLKIDSLIDIAVNKLFTIYQNPRSRDYIDLYFIVEQTNWEINNLLKKAKIKFDWHVDALQLGAQFVRVKDTLEIDYPKMIKKVSNENVEKFFLEEAKKMKADILKD